MSARSIPRHQWASFFDSFSHAHEGWLSTIVVAREGSQPMIEACDMPLRNIKLYADGLVVSIGLGARGDPDLTYTVHAPAYVALHVRADGADEGMHIETPGSVIELRFRVAAVPESLDGLAVSST